MFRNVNFLNRYSNKLSCKFLVLYLQISVFFNIYYRILFCSKWCGDQYRDLKLINEQKIRDYGMFILDIQVIFFFIKFRNGCVNGIRKSVRVVISRY